LKSIVVGLGVQGNKRYNVAQKDCVATVDPLNPKASYSRVEEVDLNSYDSAILCVPDQEKKNLINYFVENGIHMMIEKPLWFDNLQLFKKYEKLILKKKLISYTAYNHRFEPHFIKTKKILDKKILGKIYKCRLFYGNGTAKLVKNSEWRDKGLGVLKDLGSHLLDTIFYWFGYINKWELVKLNKFENNSPDHAILISKNNGIFIELEMSLLSWRNTFSCQIIGEKGSIHIDSLCKWGPSTFLLRKRKLPSGIPFEKKNVLIKNDPTWLKEYSYFKELVKKKKSFTLKNDINIFKILNNLK
jgi:predicted dehydrogenase